MAWVYKGLTAGQLDRREESVGAYDEVIARFGASDDPSIQEQVAKASVNKGAALGQLGRRDEAFLAFDDTIARFGASDRSSLQEQVAMAFINKGVTFGELGRHEEALRTFDEVIARFGSMLNSAALVRSQRSAAFTSSAWAGKVASPLSRYSTEATT